jgi:hypothetical protein
MNEESPMKQLFVFTAFLLMVCLTADVADAQNRKAGLNAAAFLKIGVGARQVGLGSAATALTGDAANMYWNPAGIVLANDQLGQASFTYNKWIADLNQQAAAVTYNFRDIGTIGVGFMTFGISGIKADRDVYPGDPALQALQIDQMSSDTYDYRDLLLQLSYARSITDQLSLGINFKYISQKIDDQSAQTVAFDFGSVYDIGVMNWKIGARLCNLGGDMKFYDFAQSIPLTFSIGTSITPYSDDVNKVMVAVDGVKPQDGLQYYYAGLEYSFMDMVSVRGGYKFNYSGANDGGSSFAPQINTTIERFSLGAGFQTTFSDYGIRLDYAYTQMDLVDAVHRITLQCTMK